MSENNLLIDNWTLQDVSTLLRAGLTNNKGVVFAAPSLSAIQVPLSGIHVESFLNTLVDLVLRQKLIVDKNWSDTWKGKNQILDSLHDKDLLVLKEFIQDDHFSEHRDYILESLSLDESVVTKYYENDKHYRAHGTGLHQTIGVVVGGTMGYLTRSHLCDAPYSPHPVRSNFLRSTPLNYGHFDATKTTMDFILGERVSIARGLFNGMEFINQRLVLDPIAIELIESSNSALDMINTAVQMRSKYKKLREHVGAFQSALDTGDLKAIKEYQLMLEDISRGFKTDGKFGATEISLGYGPVKLNKIKTPSFKAIRNKFGVRSTLGKLIMTNAGKGSFGRLFGFFGESNPKLKGDIIEYLRRENLNVSRPDTTGTY